MRSLPIALITPHVAAGLAVSRRFKRINKAGIRAKECRKVGTSGDDHCL